MMIFGRFTERAQVVLIEAQQESQNFKHGYIGTEHILLGILKEGGYASQVLAYLLLLFLHLQILNILLSSFLL